MRTSHPTPRSKKTETLYTPLRGAQLLADPFLNKGSAFSEDERIHFGLKGLLPLHVSSIDQQLARSYNNFLEQKTPIDKYIFLAALHDRNEVLFYRLIQEHMAEMIPIVYTPTVGEACQRFSPIFRRPRGLYVAFPGFDRMDQIFNAIEQDISVIVVTDGERILGLGDLGVGGMGIPIGKLSLYTLCAGVPPQKTLPVLLDVGTNNQELLNDPLYLGWRHPRLERTEYDRFVDQFVSAIQRRWPHVVLQWEDFAKQNAWRLLQRYRDKIASFNDDIQGTAAVTVAGLLRAVRSTGRSWAQERIVIAGAGSAATGIGALLKSELRHQRIPEAAIAQAIWLVDTQGLVHQGRKDLSEEKTPFALPLEVLKRAGLDPAMPIDLLSVVRQAKPTALLGTSGQTGMFDETIVRTMAAQSHRPIIFPLSNPTSKSEATPEQLFKWTDGKALVATGSPFPSVSWKGQTIPIGQCNNVFIFPGVGLGLIASEATRVPEEAFLAAARTLAAFDDRLSGFEASLFPHLEHVRRISEEIAIQVGVEIVRLGLTRAAMTAEDIPARVRAAVWNPVYARLLPAK